MFKFGKLPSAVIAIALTIAMLFSVAVPTFAFGTASVGSIADDVNGKEIVGQDVDQGKQTEYSDGIAVGDSAITENCDVYATVPDSDIVVTVPKVQILDGKSAAANVGVYTVAVRGDISAKTVITVEPQDEMDDRDGVNFEMTSAGKAGIPTDVDQAKTMFTYADGVRPDTPATTTGTITAHGMTAGIWNGDFMFNISTATVVTTTDYTLEEIEADDHLYAIGYEKPEYVVAKFNEDYTEVTITKNGADSDGAMAWYLDENKDTSNWQVDHAVIPSPMAEHADTLKVVNINNGVTTVGTSAFYNCSEIVEVNLPSSLYCISFFAFYGCSKLTEISIPTTRYYTTGETFSSEVGGFSGTFKGSIVYVCAFANCTSLEEVHFGNGTYCIGNGLFLNCTSLKNIICSPETFFQGDVNGWYGDNDLPSAFSGTSGVVVYGYGTEGSKNYTPYEWAAAHSSERDGGVSYCDMTDEPALTLEYVTSDTVNNVKEMLDDMKDDVIVPVANAYSLSYVSAFHFGLLSDAGLSEADALAIVNQGEAASLAYINENLVPTMAGGDASIKTLDDWVVANAGVTVDEAVLYMETGVLNVPELATDYADDIKADVEKLVTEHGISYYSAVLIWIDRDMTYNELQLAKQREVNLEAYVNSYYGDLFKSESGDDSIDTADEYFTYAVGASAHDVAYYIENGSWPA